MTMVNSHNSSQWEAAILAQKSLLLLLVQVCRVEAARRDQSSFLEEDIAELGSDFYSTDSCEDYED
ncbi:hypothetical protein Pyn_39627 [Prunus yedoensis var. nudiflora]|uniref:Uncharacterized protein n=1 Tax=Prunus yedoensis var. nudiflora TaxID=2094558 RepID=A0A314UKZ7_PRUYE|nr:hypothetical protein Pyn_39627 [Prunus yedoensis var. nudiflora]